jgi:predicted RND superfamily exporter protein
MAVSAVGVTQLRIDTTTSSFVDRSGLHWTAYQRSTTLFGGDEFLAIAVSGETPYSADVLARVENLSTRIRQLPGVRRVDSLATYPLVSDSAEAGFQFVRIPLGQESRPSLPAHIQSQVAKDPIAPGIFASSDGRSFAINALLDRDLDGPRSELVHEVDRLVAGRDLVSGVPVFRTKVNERTGRELMLLVPLTLGILAGLLLIAFATYAAVLASLGCALAGTFVALGAMGFLGVPLSLSTMTLPSILVALGAAYSTHTIGASRVAAGSQKRFQDVRRIVAISGLSTALGFLAMTTVSVEAIKQFALVGGIGVLVVTAASLSLGPVLMSRSPTGTNGSFERIGLAGSRVALRLIEWPRTIVCVWLASAVVIGAGIIDLRFDTNIIRWFSKDDPVRVDYEKIREAFSGITPMNVMLEGTGDAITDRDDLAAISGLARYLNGRDDIGRAIAVTDLLVQMNRTFNGVNELPGSRELAEQYLGVLSGIDLVSDLVTEDRGSANIPLRVNVNGSRELLLIASQIERWWLANGVPGVRATTTGIMHEFAWAQEAIAKGQMQGLALAFCAVAAVLCLVLRSARDSVLAVVPNILPIIIAYGVLGWLDIALDAASACIGAVALGIAVDDTVHVSVWFRRFRAEGRSPKEAVSGAIGRACPALVWTTAMVSLGFAALSMSSFMMVSNFGLITGGVMVLCLLADLSLLPALLILGCGGRETRQGVDTQEG